jgi:murein DD-endopeptidase MepM/ murein hydrolase activator NlpD
VAKTLRTTGSRRGIWLFSIVTILVLLLAAWLWAALRVGPAPAATLEVERPAIGASAKVVAHFTEPIGGLGNVKLEIQQGEHVETLLEQHLSRPGAFALLGGPRTPTTDLGAEVGKNKQPWLSEGEVVLRATADRMAGPLRSAPAVVVERRLPVRLHPPRLEVLSKQHYLRQGGSGAVAIRVGEGAVRSGVRSGTAEFLSFPLPGGSSSDRMVLFGVPYDLSDPGQIKLFVEDAAGNRAEMAFVDLFKPAPERHGRIELSDAFLERVVPAITEQTPGLDNTGTLLERYLRINGALRKVNLAKIAEISHATEPAFLWRGAFVQMTNTKVFSTFAERRDYIYNGKSVDQQTHLGLDLASTAQAAVAAANSGKVAFAGWLGIYGNAVVIDHGYGLASLYGHLSAIEVQPGATVAKGQVIARSGATGLAGGDHLHLEIFIQGHSVDPIQWLDAKWIADNIGTKLALPAQ